jgi:RNA polymerase sigma-54 factor
MQQWQDALFITKAISQRNDTILKVLDCIIEMQKDYFLHGIQYLKPMTLSNISKKTNLHESTISRINNKIVETPFGIHEIKFFFSGGIDSNLFEESISSTSIKLQIKQMIDAETIALSDDDITNTLKQQGIDISRRTVAKYRISMNIPSSHSRRSYDNYRK